MKVVFFGNHDVGIASLSALIDLTKIVGVVAHPIDVEDGVRYRSVYDYSIDRCLPSIRGTAKDSEVYDFVNRANPDLIWVTDYRYILPKKIISISHLGAVNLHPSLLPKYRGRASINWAILNGETKIGLSAHYIEEEPDAGDLIKQVYIDLTKDQDVGDALSMLLPLYKEVTKDVIGYFENNVIPRKQQFSLDATQFPARKPDDGLIDWILPARQICNLVRAVSHPYPGAFTNTQKGRIYIWKAFYRLDSVEKKITPGTIIEIKNNEFFSIQCGVGVLNVTSWTSGFVLSETFKIGDCL
jgi:methionyl-tRNA formyltransferase